MTALESFFVAMPWVTSSLASACLGYFIKALSDRKQEKHITIQSRLVSFALPEHGFESFEMPPPDLKISYNGVPCSNLCHYTIILSNNGLTVVPLTTLTIQLPKEAKIIDHHYTSTPLHKRPVVSAIDNPHAIENLYNFSDLERGDTVSIRLIVDSASKEIRCFPRNTGEVKFTGAIPKAERELIKRQFVTGYMLSLIAILSATIEAYLEWQKAWTLENFFTPAIFTLIAVGGVGYSVFSWWKLNPKRYRPSLDGEGIKPVMV